MAFRTFSLQKRRKPATFSLFQGEGVRKSWSSTGTRSSSFHIFTAVMQLQTAWASV